ncbi:MAG TPA: PAS domain S-box protein [Leptolyngbyaceae cyanobacterium]
MKFRSSPYLAALSAMVLVLAFVFLVDRSEQKRFQQQNRTAVLNQLSIIRARLEGGLSSRIFLARGLVAHVSLYPNIDRAKFERLARVMVARQTGIGSIALYKNNVISHIYPLQGHEAAIGFNPMSVPEERRAIERAIKTGNTIVAGPINLVEGGVGIISRTPIFISPPGEEPKTGRYWGLAGIIIDKDTLFKEAGLIESETERTEEIVGEKSPHPPISPSAKLNIALRGKDGLGAKGAVFFGDGEIFQQNPVILEVSFPNGSWQIAAIPVEGWPTQAPISGWLWTGGGVLALFAGVLVFIWVRSPEQLRTAVEQATNALQASKTKYRELVQNANTIILKVDTQGNIIFFNEFAQHFFGYSEAEILGKNMVGTIVPETDLSGRNLAEIMNDVLKHPEKYTEYENENIRRNKERVWVVWRNKPLFDEQGYLTGILAIGSDITDRKIAEAKLQESEQKFRTLYESTIDAVMLLDETAFFDCNRATLNIFGCTSKEQFCGKHPSQFSPEFQPGGEKSSELAAQNIATALREGSCRFEWLHCRLDGTLFPAEVWLTAIDWKVENNGFHSTIAVTENGISYCRRVVQAVVRDISKRKAREQAIQKSESKFRALFEKSGDAILLLDGDVFIDCNQAAVEMIRAKSKQDLLNLHPSQLSPELQPDGRSSFEKANINNALALAKGCLRFEWVHRRMDGTDFPVEVLLTAIPLKDKQILYVVWRDITERKWVEATLRSSERRLRRQSHALLDLASRKTLVSGDFNAAVKEITEVATATMDVERVSVWLYNDERSSIICLDLYKRSIGTHTAGLELHSTDFPDYFEALKSERIIAAHDANTDPRTSEFSASYLKPLNINSMLDAPIRVGGQMVGVICHEHVGSPRQWALEEENFAGSLADFVALAMESASRKEAQEALQKANEELEIRVEERTAALKDTNKQLMTEIVERQRSEEALQISEEKFSKAFRSSPHIITITTLKDGLYVDVNETFLNVMGYQWEEAIGKTSLELNIWANLTERQKVIEMLQSQGTVRNEECKFRKKSGDILIGLLSAEIIYLNGEACLLIVTTDITELKKAQAATDRLAAILEATPDFVGSSDLDGRVLFVNSGARQMLGIPEGEDISNFTIGDTHPAWALNVILNEAIPTAISQGIWSGESAIVNRNGQEIPVSQVMIAHQISNREIAYFSTIMRDITYRVKMEDALRQAEEKYRTIFENAVEGIFQTSPEGKYLSANPALAKIYGYASPDELIANLQDVEKQLYVDPKRRSQFIAAMHQHNSVSGFESQVYCKDGSIIWVSENARAVRDANGELLYYEGIVQNITDRKLAEEALRYQQQQTERLLLNILPQPIADRLKLQETTIADSFEAVTVLFADIVGFTELSAYIHPVELVELLNEIFSTFDALTDRYGLEKIKTIGDAYMVVGGLPTPRNDHVEAVAEMALNMKMEIDRFNQKKSQKVQLRVGISSGPVVAGVIGTKKFIYDLWGDTVNTASRMESHGIAGQIQVTNVIYELLKDRYFFQERGRIPVKGKGEMTTYFLLGKIS